MNKRLKVSLGVAATVALALTATPALAAPWDLGDIQWGTTADDKWSLDGDSFNFYGTSTEAWANDFDNGTFDDGLVPYSLDNIELVQCAAADLSDTTDGTGDMILTCDPETVDLGGSADLSLTVEMRFFADGETVRQRLIVTNDTASTVTGAGISVWNNYYQDDYTNLSYTPTLGNRLSNWPNGNTSADDILTEADNVFVADCPGGACDPAYTGATAYQAFGLGASAPSFFVDPEDYVLGGDAAGGNAGDDTWFGYNIPDLAPGQSVSVVTIMRTFLFLEGVNDTETNANALAASTAAVTFAESGGWAEGCDGQVTDGIDDWGTIINYDCTTAAVVPTPTLASTGVSTPASVVFGLAGGSALLALMGAAVVLATRRRAVK